MSGTESPPRPISIGRRITLALLVLVVVLVGAGLVQRWRAGARAASELETLMADLDATDPNWRLAELEAARAVVPVEENSARLIVAIAALHKRGWPAGKDIDPPPGTLANQRLPDAKLAKLREALAGLGTAVVEARRLAERPRGRHELRFDLHNPILTTLPDQQNARRVANLLSQDAIACAHADDFDGGLRSCQAGMNVAASLSDEPLLISQLIRTACFLLAGDAVERVLALGTASDEALAVLQRHIEAEEAHNGMVAAMRGERAAVHATLTNLSRGTLKLSDIPDFGGASAPLKLRQHIAPFSIQQLAREEHPALLRLATRSVEIARMPLDAQPAAEALLERDTKDLAQRLWLLQPLLPALSRFGETHRRKTALARCLAAIVAAERFRLKESRWPASLEELTPALLKAVPLDPADGKPLRYKRLADGVVVYSIGHDATDDGGNIDRTKPTTRGIDLGYRLWDAPKRNEASKPGVPDNDG